MEDNWGAEMTARWTIWPNFAPYGTAEGHHYLSVMYMKKIFRISDFQIKVTEASLIEYDYFHICIKIFVLATK